MSVLAEIERSATVESLTHLTGSQDVTTTEPEAICDTRRLHRIHLQYSLQVAFLLGITEGTCPTLAVP